MQISSTTRRAFRTKIRPEKSQVKKDKRALIDRLPLTETVVEMPEALLGLSGLQDSLPWLGNSLRAGVGTLALARSVQAFRSDQGMIGKLEGFSSLGLAVAAGASLLPGAAAGLVGTGAEGVHGICEMALGAHEVHSEWKGKRKVSSGLITGALGFTKGATTFLPMFMPSTGTAVGVLHVGILATSAVLNHQRGQGLESFRTD